MTDIPKTLEEARARATALGFDLNDPQVERKVEIFYRATTQNPEEFEFSYAMIVWASLMNRPAS